MTDERSVGPASDAADDRPGAVGEAADGTDGSADGTDAPADTAGGAADGGAPDAPDESAPAGDAGALTHTTDEGDVRMVDVGDKPDARRRAVARGAIRLRPGTVEAVREDEVGKGDVLATARIGAVGAVKHTWETIPMCHQIPITNVDTAFDVGEERIELEVAVETTGKTGCEMEALEGVTTGLNVVWDMVKATEKDDDGGYPETGIEDVRILEKEKRIP